MFRFFLFTSLIFSCLGQSYPYTSSCGNSTAGPGIGGVDLVDIRNQYNSTNSIDKITPKIGLKEYSAIYNGYIFYFLNTQNQDTFLKSPLYYVPQYGGFCAWGMTGKCSDCLTPDCLAGTCVYSNNGYAFINDKLYLFMVSGARTEFESNATENIELGDQMWLQVLQEQKTDYCFSTIPIMTNC